MVIQLTQKTVKESDKPIIISAFATWCPHCTKMKPIFENLSDELGKKYIFAEFDVDEFPKLTKQFDVQGLPTFIFIRDKEEIARIIGELPAGEFKKNINKYLG
jgi:thioredoxin